jgi:hypothetical protein
MDEEKDDKLRPFRWNWQALFMVALTMVALALPLIGVLWFAHDYVENKNHRPSAAATPELQQVNPKQLEDALVRAADSTLGSATKLATENEWTLRVPPAEVAARVRRIAELTRAAGGSTLETEAQPPALARLAVQVPQSRRELLWRAINGENIDFSTVPAGTETDLVELRLVKP